MFECSLKQLPELLGDLCVEAPDNTISTIRGVTTDSRKLHPGNLFIPLRGEKFDGHEFVLRTLQTGASCALTENPLTQYDTRLPLIRVRDTLAALTRLAQVWRQEAAPEKVIAITGSNGKTSTKEFLIHLIRKNCSVHATTGNLNNHIGVPLTLLSLPRKVQVAAIEMGMNHLGEIDQLSKLAAPHWGIITSIGSAHIGEVGSQEGIIKAKCELLAHLGPEAHFFTHLTHKEVLDHLQQHPAPADFVMDAPHSWPLPEDALVTSYTAHQKRFDQMEVALRDDGRSYRFRVPLFGIHYAGNLMLAVRVARRLGIPMKTILSQIRTLKPPPMRCQIVRTRPTSWVVDCYNANPESMTALFGTLFSLKHSRAIRGKICLVLGDMRELGPFTESLHRSLWRSLDHLGANDIITVGDDMRVLSETLLSRPRHHGRIHHATDVATVKDFLARKWKNWDVIALKASRGMALENALPDEVSKLVNH